MLINDVDDTYHMCMVDILDIIIHRFLGLLNCSKSLGLLHWQCEYHESQPGEKKAHHSFWIGNMWTYSWLWHLLRGVTLWIIWVESSDLTFTHQKRGINKAQQIIWQGLLEYAKHAGDITHEDANVAIVYDTASENYDKIWGGSEPLCHKDNTRMMHWNIRTPKVGLVNHAHVVYWMPLVPSGPPKRAHQTVINRSWWPCFSCLALEYIFIYIK